MEATYRERVSAGLLQYAGDQLYRAVPPHQLTAINHEGRLPLLDHQRFLDGGCVLPAGQAGVPPAYQHGQSCTQYDYANVCARVPSRPDLYELGGYRMGY